MSKCFLVACSPHVIVVSVVDVVIFNVVVDCCLVLSLFLVLFLQRWVVGKEVRGSVNGSRGSLDNIGTWKTNIVLFDFFGIVAIAFPEFQEDFCFPAARGVQIVFCKLIHTNLQS